MPGCTVIAGKTGKTARIPWGENAGTPWRESPEAADYAKLAKADQGSTRRIITANHAAIPATDDLQP